MKDTIKKIIYVILAFVFLIIGIIGSILPVLPTTPFLLVASFFFAKGSERFNKWFLSTNLYKNYLENFVESRSMAYKTKVKILALSTTMLAIAIYLVNNIYARVIIMCVMMYKYYYFLFKIKTLREKNNKGTNSIKQVDKKRDREKEVVAMMIEIYCQGNKHGDSIPCHECKSLIDYAYVRINHCPFIETKTFCNSCNINCYNVEKGVMIKDVMKYSGPRMLIHRPIMAIRHVIETRYI